MSLSEKYKCIGYDELLKLNVLLLQYGTDECFALNSCNFRLAVAFDCISF